MLKTRFNQQMLCLCRLITGFPQVCYILMIYYQGQVIRNSCRGYPCIYHCLGPYHCVTGKFYTPSQKEDILFRNVVKNGSWINTKETLDVVNERRIRKQQGAIKGDIVF